MGHTCESGGRSGCEPCRQLEFDLWDAINRYAISVGGDPSKHVHGNTSRMQAVVDVDALVMNARGAEVAGLRAALGAVRKPYAASRAGSSRAGGQREKSDRRGRDD